MSIIKELKMQSKEYAVGGLKGAVGLTPFGTAFNEFFFEAKSRIKQNRYNEFISELEIFMSSVAEKDFDDSSVLIIENGSSESEELTHEEIDDIIDGIELSKSNIIKHLQKSEET